MRFRLLFVGYPCWHRSRQARRTQAALFRGGLTMDTLREDVGMDRLAEAFLTPAQLRLFRITRSPQQGLPW